MSPPPLTQCHDKQSGLYEEVDAVVAKAFVDAGDDRHRLACGIRSVALEPAPPTSPRPDLDDGALFEEGRPFERRQLARERDPKARRAKIAHARQTLGHIRCEACGFDFEAAYGAHGRDYIECHHRNPLSLSGRRAAALADLALLCSNCHRMIHYRRPWITVEQLAQFVVAQVPSRGEHGETILPRSARATP